MLLSEPPPPKKKDHETLCKNVIWHIAKLCQEGKEEVSWKDNGIKQTLCLTCLGDKPDLFCFVYKVEGLADFIVFFKQFGKYNFFFYCRDHYGFYGQEEKEILCKKAMKLLEAFLLKNFDWMVTYEDL